MVEIRLGASCIRPEIVNGELRSLGHVEINGVALRNTQNAMLPYIDSYSGEVFKRFEFLELVEDGTRHTIRCRAISDPDCLFQERRDASCDLCLREGIWGGPAKTADLDIVIEPTQATVDGRAFSGFRYHYEFRSDDVAVHRIADRQTWELGGNLGDTTICCRNLFDLPSKRMGIDVNYSTVGPHIACLPGNLWARWSLLPSFDMQHGGQGVFLAWFDELSLIRTVIESHPGEDWLRHVDLHYFAEGNVVRSTPKSILHSPGALDAVEALNLWTRVHDREMERVCADWNIQEVDALVTCNDEYWSDYPFASKHERALAQAEEFGIELLYIGPVWENGQALKETFERDLPAGALETGIYRKFSHQNMCCTLDFEVAEVFGGEDALRKLCDRAAQRGVQVMTWIGSHYSGNAELLYNNPWQKDAYALLATKESGRHPDTGYALGHCLPLNANSVLGEHWTQQLLGVAKRTGLRGFMWDSFSNIGWWQIDHASGTKRPQIDHIMGAVAAFSQAGLYVSFEAMASFSQHCAIGQHGGDLYKGDLAGYAYRSAYSNGTQTEDKWHAEDCRVVRGEVPIDALFESFAHLRLHRMDFIIVPEAERDLNGTRQLKELIRVFKAVRPVMKRRTVLPNFSGVLWEDGKGHRVLFCFKNGTMHGDAIDVGTGQTAAAELSANRVYRLGPDATWQF